MHGGQAGGRLNDGPLHACKRSMLQSPPLGDAGHIGRLSQVETWRWVSQAAQWRDGSWRDTVCAMHRTESCRGRMRLGRGHRELSKRRWDEPIQLHIFGRYRSRSAVVGCRGRWYPSELTRLRLRRMCHAMSSE